MQAAQTFGTGAGTIERRTEKSTYRSRAFSFTVPTGWVETPGLSLESYGPTATAAVAVAPEGSAPSSLVLVLAYDMSGQPRESPDGPRLWFDWYARENEAELVEAVHEISLDGGTATQGSLTWMDVRGNPVEVEIVRAVAADALYLIQCQAEPAEASELMHGCAMIVESFRAS